jgi:VWFA-related protein
LIGGNAWVDLLKGLPVPPGGLAAAFTVDWRLLKSYAGLGAMDPDTAAAVVSGMGLRKLVTQYADLLAYYSDGFAVINGSVVLPGGVEAEPVWKKITGADPHSPPAFFRAVLEKQDGRLAAFFAALSRSDAAHQRFVTRTPARAERFYAWYRDSDEFIHGVTRPAGSWRATFMKDLPLDSAGNVRFPGGKRAWTAASAPDDETVLDLKTLEALVPVARMEVQRKSPLDEDSAKLLAQHYTEWRALFPYFERLPGLGREDFAALAAFADVAGKYPAVKQNLVLGQWHSLVELIARGVEAGSLDASASARAFRLVCEGLQAPDYSVKAWAALREMAGSATDLYQAVPDELLRLTGSRRAAFERVMELQGVPRVESASGSPDPEKTLAALSGFVYAASLDPDGLLVSEDPLLLSKHHFVTAAPNDKRASVFSTAALVGSIVPPGSYLSGGFVNFEQVAHGLANGGKIVNQAALTSHADTALAGSAPVTPSEAANVPGDVVFRTNTSLVEVYTTVTDQRGRFVDDLTAKQFSILEQGAPRETQAFETRASPVSVALLLDTTGSMTAALPALKNAALKLMDDLRPDDSVAVYSFNKSVSELQPFTTDKDKAKRAVLRTEPFGETALYDALARVSRDLSGRTGKKVIVLFTDGDDNSSTLTTDIAILRAKAVGVPVFTIAQGEALSHPEYLKQLAEVSKSTGGISFVIREPNEIAAVFEKVSEDLMHGYMLTFQAPATEDRAWHTIEVALPGLKGHKVRAREGYYPQ